MIRGIMYDNYSIERQENRGNRVIVSHENDKIIEIALTDQRVKQEDILKKLEEVRNTYIKYYTQKLNYEY